jgi:hypothetical protein
MRVAGYSRAKVPPNAPDQHIRTAQIMFPNAQHFPARFAQYFYHFKISLPVFGQL